MEAPTLFRDPRPDGNPSQVSSQAYSSASSVHRDADGSVTRVSLHSMQERTDTVRSPL